MYTFLKYYEFRQSCLCKLLMPQFLFHPRLKTLSLVVKIGTWFTILRNDYIHFLYLQKFSWKNVCCFYLKFDSATVNTDHQFQ